MRIQIIDACLYKGEHQEPGTILYLPDEDGATIISAERARRVPDDFTPPKPKTLKAPE